MKNKLVLLLIAPIGYFALWILGSIAFLIYFQIFHISMDVDSTLMIQKLPAVLSIFTVPICSFVSFYFTAKIFFRRFSAYVNSTRAFRIGLASLIFTIALDLMLTVAIQKINILLFPINVMYLLAWAVIIPSIRMAYVKGEKKK